MNPYYADDAVSIHLADCRELTIATSPMGIVLESFALVWGTILGVVFLASVVGAIVGKITDRMKGDE